VRATSSLSMSISPNSFSITAMRLPWSPAATAAARCCYDSPCKLQGWLRHTCLCDAAAAAVVLTSKSIKVQEQCTNQQAVMCVSCLLNQQTLLVLLCCYCCSCHPVLPVLVLVAKLLLLPLQPAVSPSACHIPDSAGVCALHDCQC
jgi:hypothetical protein